ncbi:hypothetical protein HOU02_gp371 [Caulobacter phage CcrBL9]|uniref:Uncharacterized protein n=1 Tax=Caulobacter phage CcrBL9 TaxID=2283270 RepID=A0A385EBT9_9CAUD|nr:hypothetical protein HOU02_gp371 [Caulobacter phage CcrBL9]AXQ69354.1 hypothetical protein CcrBL9_gp330 [Caulobacter phage CcrBL9]
MKLFVWQGGDVVRDYSSGMVVILAENEAVAWDKLRQAHLRAFVQLVTGHHFCVDHPEELVLYWEDLEPDEMIRPGFPILPVAYDINQAPVLVQWGGG